MKVDRWCFDGFANEIVFFTETPNSLKEVGSIKNFTVADYQALPRDDLDCLTYLLNLYDLQQLLGTGGSRDDGHTLNQK